MNMSSTLSTPLPNVFAVIGLIVVVASLAAACGGQPATVALTTPTEVPTAAPLPSLDLVLSGIATPTATPTATPEHTPAAGEPTAVSDYYESRSNMFRIFSGPEHPVNVALEGVRKARVNKDPSQFPIILEIMRFFPSPEFQREADETLKALSGQPPEGTEWIWPQWMEWLGANASEFRPPEDYATWKSVLMTTFDPRYREFFPPGAKSANVDLMEVTWGGIAPESNPDLRLPAHVAAEAADYLSPDDRVYGLSINGVRRAYPLRIMNTHEIVNDVLGGENLVLAHSILVGAGIAYRSEVNGTPSTFGTSGLIYRSDPVMFDRLANTLWLQYTGQPIMGAAADPGVSLDRLPVVLTTWQEWADRHPDTTVLSIITEFFPPDAYVSESTPGSILLQYESFDDTIFPVWNRSNALALKDLVLGVSIDESYKAYPVPALQQAGVVNDAVGAAEIVVVASAESQAARVYERGGLEFSAGDAPTVLLDADGDRWLVDEEHLVNVDDPSRTLPRLATHMSYWFAWYAFHPETEVYAFERD